eukprot:scaffold276409_cov26-Tisochrysis_lutea.AAC.1
MMAIAAATTMTITPTVVRKKLARFASSDDSAEAAAAVCRSVYGAAMLPMAVYTSASVAPTAQPASSRMAPDRARTVTCSSPVAPSVSTSATATRLAPSSCVLRRAASATVGATEGTAAASAIHRLRETDDYDGARRALAPVSISASVGLGFHDVGRGDLGRRAVNELGAGTEGAHRAVHWRVDDIGRVSHSENRTHCVRRNPPR